MKLCKHCLTSLLIFAAVLTLTGFIFVNLIGAESINVSIEVKIAQCSDGLDNDDDGKTDFPNDPGCSSAVDDNESDEKQCSDTIDNDGDGKIDFPNDPGCTSTSDDDETDPASIPSSGGGGGGGGIIVTSVTLEGRAYPKSSVTILIDGVIKDTVIADNRAFFNRKFNLDSGFHSFAVYSADNKGRRSLTYTFSLNVNKGTISKISGIFIAPTIDIDKSQVRKGEVINILGQTAPSSNVSIFINSEHEIIEAITTDNNGAYFLAFNTNPLNFGDHNVKSRSSLNDNLSAISQVISFKVGTKTIAKILVGDFAKDGRVNIIDFSILLFWWGNTTPQALEIADINKDKRVDLKDLSIMLFYWTG